MTATGWLMHRRKLRTLACVTLMTCGLAASNGAFARQRLTERPGWVEVQAEIAPTQRERGAQISLQQAIEMARRQYPGRVVRADTTTRNGRVVHEIRILGDDSRVRTVQIDAQSTVR